MLRFLSRKDASDHWMPDFLILIAVSTCQKQKKTKAYTHKLRGVHPLNSVCSRAYRDHSAGKGWIFNSNIKETFSNLPLNSMHHLHKTSVSTLASTLHAERSRGRCCTFIIADLSWHNVRWSKVPRRRAQLQLARPSIGRQISDRFFCVHHWKFKGVWTFSDESTDAVGLRGVITRSEQTDLRCLSTAKWEFRWWRIIEGACAEMESNEEYTKMEVMVSPPFRVAPPPRDRKPNGEITFKFASPSPFRPELHFPVSTVT